MLSVLKPVFSQTQIQTLYALCENPQLSGVGFSLQAGLVAVVWVDHRLAVAINRFLEV